MSAQESLWSKAQSVLEVATKLTIIGVPALYLMGWAYLEAHWKVFGISETLLGLSAADYVRAGSMVFVRHIVGGSSWVAILACAALLILILVTVLRVTAMPMLFGWAQKIQSIVRSLRREPKVDPKHRRLARAVEARTNDAHTWLLNVLLIFLLVLCLVYVAIQPSGARGEAAAQKQISDLASFPTPERDWVLGYTTAESARPALVMGCGSDMCVLLRDNKTEVIPRSAVTRMETCRRVGKADDGAFHCIARTDIL